MRLHKKLCKHHASDTTRCTTDELKGIFSNNSESLTSPVSKVGRSSAGQVDSTITICVISDGRDKPELFKLHYISDKNILADTDIESIAFNAIKKVGFSIEPFNSLECGFELRVEPIHKSILEIIAADRGLIVPSKKADVL